MQMIYKTIYGSKLYGTNIDSSDTDYKGVFVIPTEDFIFGRNFKDVVNGKDDEKTEHEYYSLQKYLSMLRQGQTGAIDMLYAAGMPQNLNNPEHQLFIDVIYERRHNFLSQDLKRYVAYAKRQAEVNSDRGARYQEAVDSIETLKKSEYAPDEKLKTLYEAKGYPILYDDDVCFGGSAKTGIKWLYVFGKQLPLDRTVGDAINLLQSFVDKYGKRSKDAGVNNIDLKGIMHCMRACFELKELVETGDIEFPLKEAEFLRSVRLGKHDEDWCVDKAEEMCEEADSLVAKSGWPEHCDYDTCEIISEIYDRLDFYRRRDVDIENIGCEITDF